MADNEGFAAIKQLLPEVYSGARCKDDRRIRSGFIYVPRSVCRWQDCPAIYGPSTTVSRWAEDNRDDLCYPSDLTDAEWRIMGPLLPPPAGTGRH